MRDMIIQLSMAFLGSAGFSLLFHLRRKYLFITSFGGMITWAVYLAVFHYCGDVFWSCLLAAVFGAVYGELQARLQKAPSTIFFIPTVVPLIPGSNLYYTLFYIVDGKNRLAWENALKTGKYALAIAIGTAIVSTGLYMWEKCRKNDDGTDMDRCDHSESAVG